MGLSVENIGYSKVIELKSSLIFIENPNEASVTKLSFEKLLRLEKKRNGPTRKKRIVDKQKHPQMHFSVLEIFSPSGFSKATLLEFLLLNIATLTSASSNH